MTLRVLMRNATDSGYTDITDRILANTLEVTTNAEEGSVAISQVVLDDESGDLDVGGHRAIIIDELQAEGDTRLFSGYTGERQVMRGPATIDGITYGRGTSRVWKVQLVDLNSVLYRRLMIGSDTDRGAESDIARVQWVEATNEGSLIGATTYLSTANGVAMSPHDYAYQTFVDVLRDCAEQSGKDYWISSINNIYTLWYDFSGSTAYSSTIKLSNYPADIDETTVFPFHTDETYLVISPERVYSGVHVPWTNGDVYETKPATATTFALGGRDVTMSGENITTETAARARATRYLNDLDTEELIVHCTYTIAREKVNLIREGMRVQLRASHLPDLENYTWARVLKRTVRQVSETEYQVTIEAVVAEVVVVEEGVCEGGQYALTASGSYAPLNSLTTNDDAVFYYWNPGVAAPVVPTPAHVGNWHFAQLGSGGNPDYAGDCSENYLRVMVVGDGTLEIDTRQYGGTARSLYAWLRHDAGGEGWVTDEEQTGIAAGDTVTFTVSTHGGTECVHWVDIRDTGGTCGSKWGHAGATWTPSP